MKSWLVFCLLLLSGFCLAAAVPPPLNDPAVNWSGGQGSRTPQGVLWSWNMRTDLPAQDLSERLESACGAFHRALRLHKQWVFSAQHGNRSCVLWLDGLHGPDLSGSLSMSEAGRPEPMPPAPIPGPVLWQHEQQGEGRVWLVQVQDGWRTRLGDAGWRPAASGSVWRREQSVLEVVEVEHGRLMYLLVICRGCTQESP